MSCKLHATLFAFLVLFMLLLNLSFAVADASSESELAETEDEGRSYFGYRPKPKDSYKKLAVENSVFATIQAVEWMKLWTKIAAVHKKLYPTKDKDGHGGYGYSNQQKMQQLLSKLRGDVRTA